MEENEMKNMILIIAMLSLLVVAETSGQSLTHRDSAAYKYAHRLRIGLNTSVDYQKARRILTALAQKGYARAYVDLSFMAYYGNDSEQNPKLAMELSQKANELGSIIGAYLTGYYHLIGANGEQNYKRAFEIMDSCSTKEFPMAYYLAGGCLFKGY